MCAPRSRRRPDRARFRLAPAQLSQPREPPGLAPAALFHIIGHPLLLKLADVASGLPPYEEQIQVARLDDEPNLHGFSQASAYQRLALNLKRAWLQALEREQEAGLVAAGG